MATFEDSKSVNINKQYQDILQNIPLSAPYDLRRAVELAAKDLRDFRLTLHGKQLAIQQKCEKELERTIKQTQEKHEQLIRNLNQAKKSVMSWKK